MIDNIEIEKVLVDKCIELYMKVFAEHGEIEAEKKETHIDFGTPPGYLVLREYDAVRRTEHFYKRTFVKAWIYKDGEFVTKQDDVTCEEDRVISGMYYDWALGDFYWDPEKMKAFVNMTYGPKYGRGYSYDIRLEGDMILLENEKMLWVS